MNKLLVVVSVVLIALPILFKGTEVEASESIKKSSVIELGDLIEVRDEVIYVAETLGTEPEIDTFHEPDELGKLFNKFNVPFEYREYTRQICELQNVDPIIFVSLVQIESHWGNSEVGVTSDYNKVVYYRMYGNKKQWTDLGLGQLSTRYKNEHEDRYFNPELIMSLGYIREFGQRDPYVNLQVAASYLGFLYRYFGSYDKAVKAYNCGMGNVIKNNIPKITYEYANAIMNSYKFREGDI